MLSPIELAPSIKEHISQLRQCKTEREMIGTFNRHLAYEIVSSFAEMTNHEASTYMGVILRMSDTVSLQTIDTLMDIYAYILQLDKLAEDIANGVLHG